MENSSIELFSVIYNAHPGVSMEYIGEELTKARIAIAQSEKSFKEFMNNYDYRLSLPAASTKLALSREEIEHSITEDHIVCAICGKRLKKLTNHLRKAHNMEPEEYRRLCGLKPGIKLQCTGKKADDDIELKEQEEPEVTADEQKNEHETPAATPTNEKEVVLEDNDEDDEDDIVIS